MWEGEVPTVSATSEIFSFTVLAATGVERKVRMAMKGRLNMVGRWRKDVRREEIFYNDVVPPLTSCALSHQRINSGDQVGM